MKKQKTNARGRWQKPAALLLTVLVTVITVLGQPVQALAAVNDGSPWVDYSLQENLAQVTKTDAKDDFYLDTNYEWLKNAQLKAGSVSESQFSMVSDEVVANAKALLVDKTIKGHDAQLVQSLYDSYLDWDARNKAGVKPIKPTVNAIKKISTMKELSDFICTNSKLTMGVPRFVTMANNTSLTDSSFYITYVNGDGFLLGDAAEYTNRTELGERIYEAYKKQTVAMLKRLGYTSKEAKAMFDRVIKFEGKLAKVSFTSADMMAPDYIQRSNNEMSNKKTMKLMKTFPLKRYLTAMGYGDAKKYSVDNLKYMETVDKLYTKKNLSVIKEYMIVHYVLGMSSLLDRKAFDLNVATANAVYGSSGQRDDEEYAYYTVTSMLSVPMQKVYLQQNNAAEKKATVTALCEKTIAEYRGMLKETTWMSEQTKEKAIEKLDAVKINVVSPDQWPDYSALKLKGKSYFDDYLAIAIYESKRNQSLTNGKVDKNAWQVNTLDTNAYYMMTDNSINILLGILGGDFYKDDMATEELYAGIGTVIAHEISHAFDPTGSQFDAQGNYANWWTEADQAEFSKRADKLIAYYDKIVAFNGTNVNGTSVQGEVVADMTGMDCMLRLAKAEKNFDYDKFFRQYAKVWKEVMTPEYTYLALTQDSHPLSYLRVNVTVQQFQEFYDTYQVKQGDHMYLAPEERLTIW